MPDELHVDGSVDELFRGSAKRALEQVLVGYVAKQRWFREKARAIRAATLVDVLPLQTATEPLHLAIVETRFPSLAPQRYVLPLAFATGERATSLAEHHPNSIVAPLTVGPTAGLLHDATLAPTFGPAFLALFTSNRGPVASANEPPSTSGAIARAHLTCETSAALRALLDSGTSELPARALRGEQTNTSIVFGDRAIAKLLRKVEPGTSVDVEMGRFLTERAGYRHTPDILGVVDYIDAEQRSATLAIVQRHVKNQGDAWSLTLAALARHLEHAGATETLDAELPLVRRLAERVAELHIALCRDDRDPAFAPEPLTFLAQRLLHESARERLGRALADLRRPSVLDGLTPDVRERARRLAAHEEALEAQLRRITAKRLSGLATRCHGDLHLGQVLFDGEDFFLIDFEGEPARPLDERRQKRSPMVDVAGMLRSFAYAAEAALREAAARGGDPAQLRPWAEAFARAASDAFLDAYLARAADAPFLPEDPSDLHALVDFFVLDKCIYELAYELENRPDWLSIPLHGLERALDARVPGALDARVPGALDARVPGALDARVPGALDAPSQRAPVTPTRGPARAAMREALALLGKRRFALAIHDASFPATAAEDIGRSSPYGEGARSLVAYAHALGFDAIQLGPQGKTTLDNASPYDGNYLSRNPISVDLFSLARDPETSPFVPTELLERAVAERPGNTPALGAYAHAARASEAILDAFHARFVRAREAGEPEARALDAELAAFRRTSAPWLDRDALYDSLSRANGRVAHPHFPDPRDRTLFARHSTAAEARNAGARFEALCGAHAAAIERYALSQLLWKRQHQRFRGELHALGLVTFGDLQVGGSPADSWSLAGLVLPDYRMGAPPSRTNPEGQPWGYAVLDPDLYGEPGREGAAIGFVRARVEKLLEEHDGMRVDHPHGLVCPWVYRADDPDPHRAVRAGARLFCSPDMPDHPELARYAIARAQALDRSLPRFADGWVRELDDDEVARYAVLVDACLETFRSRGRDVRDFACEVLSTAPHPLVRVLARHGLGRFRVTQKAQLDDPDDVYRTENASAEDWVMVGTHDTPPIYRTAERWNEHDRRDRAAYLAWRLGDPKLAPKLAADLGSLVHAQVADLFVSDAEQVVLFFADLFGLTDVYNEPGTTHERNWKLRLLPDFEARHREDARAGRAIDLTRALSMALAARPELADRGEAMRRAFSDGS